MAKPARHKGRNLKNIRKMKNKKKAIIAAAGFMACCYAVLNYIGKRKNSRSGHPEQKDAEGTAYEKKIKPVLDKILSFAGMILLAPFYVGISAVVFLDDPGPVFFTQERIGRGKEHFRLHKFRSMKMSTPHDVPTHQLSDPEQYITRVGKFLRKYSLDELPQIWDIFVGNMSIIGPRPALWNQDDLIAERDKYGANDVKPGLTGWAQINGRDELEIEEKAKLDGEYVRQLRQGGMRALFFDLRCLFGTVFSVLGSRGVVEGGTGELKRKEKKSESGEAENRVTPEEAGFEDYGHRKHFDIDSSEKNKKRVLITGAGSYIGESFENWAEEHYPENFIFDTLDMQDPSWIEADFSPYDAVFHVAGIAHADIGKVSEEEKKKYYAVNTDLAIETAEKAKAEGVRQFVFMSSMIIYGDSAPYGKEKVIDEHTLPAPANFYGDSKWQADKGVRMLADESFRVAVLRPPMIYGRGSKGNYRTLEKLVRKLPVFPDVENRRSMLFIGNLCEFLCRLMLSGEGGIYFPQNKEYTKTGEMAREIAEAAGKKIWMTKLLRPAVTFGSYIPGKISGLVNKAFGNSVYSQELSRYSGLDYQVMDLKSSIKTGEEGDRPVHILVVSQYFYPETFRINDMAAEWVKRGYKVTVLTGIPNYPMGKFFEGYDYIHRRREIWNGVDIIRIPLIPRGNSRSKLVSSLGMAANYFSFVVSGWRWKTMNDIGADIVFTCEVSPMTQALIGVWYAKRYHIPHFLYVQDLWPENVETVTGIKSRAVIYPIDRMVDYIYQNTDQIFTTSHSFVDSIVNRKVKVGKEKVHYWPQYAEEFYRPLEREQVRLESNAMSPIRLIPDDDAFHIAFTGNIGTAQGLEILPQVAERHKEIQTERAIRFVIIGDGRYQETLEEEIRKRKVEDSFIMIPRQKPEEIPKLLACCDAAFLSFSDEELWEKTIPAKLQSYMACGMPIIAAAKGEAERVIKEAECGKCCEIGNIEGVLKCIKKMMGSDLYFMSRNSRMYFEKYYKKDILMNKMDEWIKGKICI